VGAFLVGYAWYFKPLGGACASYFQRNMTQPGIAIKLTATPGSIRSRPPAPGEHTDQVLRELGRAPADIAALRAACAV